jgi:DNA-binding beta-propeller fold protein YncE
MDDPPGEPRHRRIAYDSVNKHLFVANRARNRVEVFSTADQTRAAQISVPGASSADLSADGSTVWVGTSLEEIVAIDTPSLQIRNRYAISPIPNVNFDRPIEVLALSNGRKRCGCGSRIFRKHYWRFGIPEGMC